MTRGCIRRANSDVANGVVLAVEKAGKIMIEVAYGCVEYALEVEVGNEFEVNAAIIVSVVVHLGGQLAHMRSGGDDVRVFESSAAAAETLRPRHSGREQGEHQEQRESAFRFGFQRIVCFVNN